MKNKIKTIYRVFRRLPLATRISLPIAGLLIFQLCLPSGKILPRTSLSGISLRLRAKSEVLSELKYKSEFIRLKIADDHETFKAGDTGVMLDADRTAEQLPTLSLTDKLVPFRPIAMMLRETNATAIVHKDHKQINTFANELSKKHSYTPVNARAEIKSGQLLLTDEDHGEKVLATHVAAQLRATDPFTEDVVKIPAEVIPAAVTKEDLQAVEKTFKAAKSQPLNVTFGDTNRTLDTNTVIGMVQVTPDSKKDQWWLTFREDAISERISGWASVFDQPPGVTQISYLDDKEVSRKVGANGRALDRPAIKTQLNHWLRNPSNKPVALASVVLYPRVEVTADYSNLQAKISSWASSHDGQYWIAVQELAGTNRSATYNSTEQVVMASTYKTFLAFVTYSQSEKGELSLDYQLPNGKTINDCIRDMIVVSDDDCSVAIGEYIGWTKVDEIIASAGFQSVRLNNYNSDGSYNGDKLANAHDQARLLSLLSSGSLISSGNVGTLFSHMKSQIYRSGIPAGSRGAPVADKVGFLFSYIHDAGIVYGPNSTYALVILTDSSSWSNIRELSQIVYDYMN